MKQKVYICSERDTTVHRNLVICDKENSVNLKI